MIITYHGVESFRIKFGDTTLAFNPVSKKSSMKSSSFGADIALVTTMHPDMDGVDAVTRGDKKPFVINGPGEYEIGGITVEGYRTTSSHGGEKRGNTLYIVSLEDIRLCFVGALDSTKLPDSAKESLDEIDVLFVPVGGNGVLEPKEAHELAVKLGAGIIIPMHYDEAHLKKFLREEGESNGKPLDKLTLKRKDLVGKSGEIVILRSV